MSMVGSKIASVIPAKAGIQSYRGSWAPAFAGATKVVLLAAFVTLTLAACGRKDVPDYPPDAIERPGTLNSRRDSIRYY
jgi:predicted small lipoprotein YifL